ncbi:Early light-induced protein 2 chloroplastic [Bienertia sinuspersici]
MQMQSFLVNPNNAYNNGSNLNRMAYPLGFNPLISKRVNIGVKCMAEKRPNGEPKLNSGSPKSNTTVYSTPSPKPQSKVSTNFTDLFAFNGPAPERINGRLAMIGFVAAIAIELSQGTDLLTQISNGGSQWFLGISILLSVASLVPLFKGSRAEAKTEGLMNANAELWNGRLAMLGLVALAVTELAKGSALI